VALIFVLWLIVLLSMLGGSHARNVRLDSQLAANQVDGVRARLLAESGVNRAILELFVSDRDLRWPFDGRVVRLQQAQGSLRIRIRNAEGLVDLNSASAETLAALLRTQELDPKTRDALVDAIMDWRDPDDLRRLHGAEDRDYRFAGLPYGTPDRNFAMLDELRYVLGMRAELFERLRPFLTLYSGRPGINPQYAPPQLLEALRSGTLDQASTAFSLDPAGDATEPPPDAPGAAASKVFHIRVEAETPTGSRAALEVVVDTASAGGAAYSILSWREVATEAATKEQVQEG